MKVFAGCLTEEGVKRFQDDPVFRGISFRMDITKKEDLEKAFKSIKEQVGEEGKIPSPNVFLTRRKIRSN